MADVEISGPARRDLREIHHWIAQDDPAVADRVLSDLHDAVTRLAEMRVSATFEMTWQTRHFAPGPCAATW